MKIKSNHLLCFTIGKMIQCYNYLLILILGKPNGTTIEHSRKCK